MMTNTCHQASILKVFLQSLLSLFICSNKQILTSIIHTGNNLQATDDLASCSIPRLMLFHLIPLSEYDPVYRTLRFSGASLMHLRSSSVYSDTLHMGLCMLCNSALPPASAPWHVPPLLVC